MFDSAEYVYLMKETDGNKLLDMHFDSIYCDVRGITSPRCIHVNGKILIEPKLQGIVTTLLLEATPSWHSYFLSRASEVGSPTNHLGSGQRKDTGPGILWVLYVKYLDRANLVINH